MPDIIDALPTAEARLLRRLAAAAECPVETMATEILRGYFRLLRDAPEALPPDPLAPLARRARADAGRRAAQ